MYINIRSTDPHAGMISHLLAKNPYNQYDRNEKGARVRMVYPVFEEQELEVLLFVTPDPIELVKSSPDSYDITQYINDREFAVSSLFCSYIRPALGTALNGKPKSDYAKWVDYAFSLEVSFGPVASNLPDHVLCSFFTALGYEVELERAHIDYSFDLKNNSSIRAVHLRGQVTIQQMLQQLFVLIPVIDDYKHYYIGDEEIDKLHRYGQGWLTRHPQHQLIIKRALRFAPLIRQYVDGLPAAEQSNEIQADSSGEVETDEYSALTESEPKAPRLNELRYRAILEQVKQLNPRRRVIDLGAGEGKLSERLAKIQGVEQVWAVEPSARAGVRAVERFAVMEEKGIPVVPKLASGSLFYRDDRWTGCDVMILCEVIEHINEPRLPMVMRTLLDEYRPQTLIITTPNQEYNAVYDMGEQMRHTDHRFEWTRHQFETFCTKWSDYGRYEVTIHGIGEQSDDYGQPTQMAVFRRKGGEQA